MTRRLVGTDDDAQTARQRIIAQSGGDIDPGRIDYERSIVAINDNDGVMILELAPNRVWYVQHLWGRSAGWLHLDKLVVQELIDRGHGDTPVRFRQLDNLPDMKAIFQAQQLRLVIDDDSGRELWEMTANQAMPLIDAALARVR